jgi:SAM-dependent methyltransferase
LITSWQATPMASRLIAAEATLLAGVMDDVYGLELLQLGQWGMQRELLSVARIRNQSVVAQAPGAGIDMVARLTHLPVQSSAIDALLLPHVLEFETDPHAVLREADRVLVGEGQIVILGFRPAGPWGWRAAASRSGFPPGLRRLLSEQRVRDWLRLLRFEITTVKHYLYALPTEGSAAKGAAGSHNLRRGWFYPWPASAYLIKARKRVYSVTPLRARKRERRALLGGAMEPST